MSETVEKKIERHNVVQIDIGADDWQGVIAAMQKILFDMEKYTNGEMKLVSGGSNSGYTVDARVNKEMTHDKYFEEIQKWFDEKSKGGA